MRRVCSSNSHTRVGNVRHDHALIMVNILGFKRKLSHTIYENKLYLWSYKTDFNVLQLMYFFVIPASVIADKRFVMATQ